MTEQKIKRGDRVVRRSGSKVAGTVLRVEENQQLYGREYRRGDRYFYRPPQRATLVRVRWEKATRRLCGSTHTTTTIRADSLRVIEEQQS